MEVGIPKFRIVAPPLLAASLFRTRHASSLLSRLPYTDQFRFLDKAAVVVEYDSEVDDASGGCPRDPWLLCSLQQVEEAKCVLRIMPAWGTCICQSQEARNADGGL